MIVCRLMDGVGIKLQSTKKEKETWVAKVLLVSS
jgi:hypothetical protein